METVQVICKKCKASRVVRLNKTLAGTMVDWLENKPDEQIISFRERLDGQYGWECMCGNNDLMTKQEKKTIKDYSSPKSQEINEIIKNLQPDKPNFEVR